LRTTALRAILSTVPDWSETVLKIALRAAVRELQRLKERQFQRKSKKNQKRPFSTFQSLQGGHVNLADTPVIFFMPVGHMPFSVTEKQRVLL
jgi:hypothetical protein